MISPVSTFLNLIFIKITTPFIKEDVFIAKRKEKEPEINYAKKHIGLCADADFGGSLELALCDLQEALKFLNIIKEQLKDSE